MKYSELRIMSKYQDREIEKLKAEVERLNRATLTEQAEAETQRAENKRLRTAVQRISDVDGGFKECLDKELMKERAEVERLREDHGQACELVARMHAAAIGEVSGPRRGVVEDVEDLKAEVERLRESLLGNNKAYRKLARKHVAADVVCDQLVVYYDADEINEEVEKAKLLSRLKAWRKTKDD